MERAPGYSHGSVLEEPKEASDDAISSVLEGLL